MYCYLQSAVYLSYRSRRLCITRNPEITMPYNPDYIYIYIPWLKKCSRVTSVRVSLRVTFRCVNMNVTDVVLYMSYIGYVGKSLTLYVNTLLVFITTPGCTVPFLVEHT